jgi:hypothetical protein
VTPQLDEELMEQLEMETAARGDSEMTCQEAASVLREASATMEDPLQGIGQPPRPKKTVPRCSLASSNTCARAWRACANALTKLHMARRRPDWVQRANDNHENSCDALIALDAKNTHLLSGWIAPGAVFVSLQRERPRPSSTTRDEIGVAGLVWGIRFSACAAFEPKEANGERHFQRCNVEDAELANERDRRC